MAIVKAINSKSSISHVVNYVADKNKTNEELMYGKDCSSNPDQAIEDMKTTKELYNKEDGRQYKHFVQSFDPKDNITPEKANQIGREWAEKNFKGYEVFIATHTDKEHLHNHFVVNTVNFETGEKYRQSRADLNRYKEISDKICEREGLTKTPNKSNNITTFNSKKYKAIEQGIEGKKKSYLIDIGRVVERNTNKSISKENFINNMESEGYKVKWSDTAKNVTYEDKDGHKVRSSNLEKTFKEEKFNKEQMLNQFEKNKEIQQQEILLQNEKRIEEENKRAEERRKNELKEKNKKRTVKEKPTINVGVMIKEKYRIEDFKEIAMKSKDKIEDIRNKIEIKINNSRNSEKTVLELKKLIEEEKENRKQLGFFRRKEKQEIDKNIEKYESVIEKNSKNILSKEEFEKYKNMNSDNKTTIERFDKQIEKYKDKINDYNNLIIEGKAQQVLGQDPNKIIKFEKGVKQFDKQVQAELYLLQDKKYELSQLKSEKELFLNSIKNEVDSKFVEQDINYIKNIEKQENKIINNYGNIERIDERINNLTGLRSKENEQLTENRKKLFGEKDSARVSLENELKKGREKSDKSLSNNDIEKLNLSEKDKEVLKKNLKKDISKERNFERDR